MLIIPSAFASETNAPTDETLIKFVQQRTNAVRITQNPYQMETFVMMRCIGPSPEEVRVAQKEKTLGISDPHIKNLFTFMCRRAARRPCEPILEYFHKAQLF